MNRENPSEDPCENPFEVYEDSKSHGGGIDHGSGRDFADQEYLDHEHAMPPIERSYWIGVATLLALGLIGFFSGGILFGSMNRGGILNWLSWIFVPAMWISLGVPLALLRLVLHRFYLARFIKNQTYLGAHRFGFWYLCFSMVLSWLSIIGGGVLFFGICTAIFISSNYGLFDVVPYNSPQWIAFAMDGILSLLFAGYLTWLGVPKYR